MVEAYINKYYEYEALTSVKSESVEDSPILSKAELKKVIGEQARKHEEIELESDFHSFIAGAIWMHDFASNSEAMKREYQRAVCVYSDQHRAEFEYRRTEHLNPIVTSYSARAGQYEVGRVYIIKIIRD
jgi:hypothetical protein